MSASGRWVGIHREVDVADFDVFGECEDGVFDFRVGGAAKLEELGVGGDIDVKDVFIPFAGARGAGDFGGEDVRPVLGEAVEERAYLQVEAFEGLLDDLREWGGGDVQLRRVGVNGQAGDDVTEKAVDVAVVDRVTGAGKNALATFPVLLLTFVLVHQERGRVHHG